MSGLCTVSYCPKKKDPDWHRCFVCDAPNVEHHHVKPRGMGGSKKRKDDPLNVVALCRPHHEMVTLHECSDDILDFPGRGKVYVYFDLHGNTLIEREVLSAAAARSAGNPDTRQSNTTSAAAPSAGLPIAISRSEKRRFTAQGADFIDQSPGTKEEGDGRLLVESVDGGGDSGGSGVPDGTDILRPSLLTHEQRVAIAQAIKDAKQRHPFFAGDTANLWEEQLNDEFWSRYADKFGYTYPSLRNVMRVCKRIPPPQRHPELSFAHHDVMDGHDIETREAWLERAFDEEWPVKRLREELVAEGLLTTKPRVKRYSVEELLPKAEQFLNGYPEPPRAAYTEAIDFFLDWLEEQA